MSCYDPGDRVDTPFGAGTVRYSIMLAPDYTEVRAYSVALDARSGDSAYTGTMIPASDVHIQVTPPATVIRAMARRLGR